jgi:hypothetical protein
MKRSLDIIAVALSALLLLGFAVLSFRGLIDPLQASARFGAPGVRCRWCIVLSGVSVAQPGHRHCGRGLPAVAAMEAAGYTADGDRGLAAVRR